MTELSHPVAPPAAHRAWLWLLPLTLATTLVLALAVLSVLFGNAVTLMAGGGFLSRQDTIAVLLPLPGTVLTWIGLPLALLRPQARTGAVVTLTGVLAVALAAVFMGAGVLTLPLWATVLLGLLALRTPPQMPPGAGAA